MARVLQRFIEDPHPCAYLPDQTARLEVRVMVEPSEVSDADAVLLAREISKKIEEELAYPGQIRVTIVRETRAVDYAK